jgi:starvation-inducible outer membrane lipoprotein
MKKLTFALFLLLSACASPPEPREGKAKANRSYWTISHTIRF